MKSRCEKDNGVGNCEKSGAMYYPKCKSGYYAVGCCTCKPNTPNCTSLGMNNGIDVSCAKKIVIGNPNQMQCSFSFIKSSSLCFNSCREGYKGISSICLNNSPNDFINCGLVASNNDVTCVEFEQNPLNAIVHLSIDSISLGDNISENQLITSIEKSVQVKEFATKINKMINLWTSNQSLLREKMYNFDSANAKMSTIQNIASTNPNGNWNDIMIQDITSTVGNLFNLLNAVDVSSMFSEPVSNC